MSCSCQLVLLGPGAVPATVAVYSAIRLLLYIVLSIIEPILRTGCFYVGHSVSAIIEPILRTPCFMLGAR